MDGHFTTKTYLSAQMDGSGGDASTEREPQLIYSGYVNPMTASRHIIEEFLNGVGSILAHTLRQEKVHIILSTGYEGWDIKLIPPKIEEEVDDFGDDLKS
ncbi:MAG: hypothetical protein WC793_01115 [Candidatus Paceibacterota bacterium]